MYRRCDWLWGELTLESVIFQSVFFVFTLPHPKLLTGQVTLIHNLNRFSKTDQN